MRRCLLLLLFTLPTALPQGSAAQGGSFELTPFFGYQFGGSFDSDDRDFGIRFCARWSGWGRWLLWWRPTRCAPGMRWWSRKNPWRP